MDYAAEPRQRLGAAAIGLGICFLIRAGFGVAPLDALNTGLAARTGLDVGTSSWITAAVLIALAFLLGRKVRLGTIAGSFLIGVVINVALPLIPNIENSPARVALATVGLLVLYLGISLIINAALGAGPAEELMLGLVGRGQKLYVARWGIEAALFLAGFMLGGQVGAITLIFVLLTGPALHVLIPRVGRLCSISALSDNNPDDEQIGMPR